MDTIQEMTKMRSLKLICWLLMMVVLAMSASALTINRTNEFWENAIFYERILILPGTHNFTLENCTFYDGITINESSDNVTVLNGIFNLTEVIIAGDDNYFNGNNFTFVTFIESGSGNDCMNGSYWNTTYSGSAGCAPPNLTGVGALTNYQQYPPNQALYARNLTDLLQMELRCLDQTNTSSGFVNGVDPNGILFNVTTTYYNASALRGTKGVNHSEGWYNITSEYCIDSDNNKVYRELNATFEVIFDNSAPRVTIINPSNASEYATGTTSVTVEWETNETTTCRYQLSDAAFNFGDGTLAASTVNGTRHSVAVSTEDGHDYALRTICRDVVDLEGTSVVTWKQKPASSIGTGGTSGGDLSQIKLEDEEEIVPDDNRTRKCNIEWHPRTLSITDDVQELEFSLKNHEIFPIHIYPYVRKKADFNEAPGSFETDQMVVLESTEEKFVKLKYEEPALGHALVDTEMWLEIESDECEPTRFTIQVRLSEVGIMEVPAITGMVTAATAATFEGIPFIKNWMLFGLAFVAIILFMLRRLKKALDENLVTFFGLLLISFIISLVFSGAVILVVRLILR